MNVGRRRIITREQSGGVRAQRAAGCDAGDTASGEWASRISRTDSPTIGDRPHLSARQRLRFRRMKRHVKVNRDESGAVLCGLCTEIGDVGPQTYTVGSLFGYPRDTIIHRQARISITVVTRGRLCLFGDLAVGEMVLNEAGEMAQRVWEEWLGRFPNIEMDTFIVMPIHTWHNHRPIRRYGKGVPRGRPSQLPGTAAPRQQQGLPLREFRC